jgi:Flp pilus assembly protein TadG
MTIKNQKGAAAVEFAIVLPLLLLFAFGIIEFSLLYYNKHVITNASREGARAGIAKSYGGSPVDDTAAIAGIVNSYCQDHLITFGGSTSPVLDPPPVNVGLSYPTYLTVSLKYDYYFLVYPLLGIGTPLQIKAETVMQNM